MIHRQNTCVIILPKAILPVWLRLVRVVIAKLKFCTPRSLAKFIHFFWFFQKKA
jgi:hypothetical protein